MEDLFNKAIALLTDYQSDSSLDITQGRILAEAIDRLKTLAKESASAIQTNAALLDGDPGIRQMREFMTEEKINEIMNEEAKRDKKLAAYLASIGGRLFKKNSSEVSAYDLSKLNEESTPNAAELRKLHSTTEAIYHNLWAIKGRISQLPNFTNFNPSGVRDVRNHLIEHTEKKGSEAHIYSFGVATRGPVLRPIKPTGVNAPHDAGLETNLEQFLLEIIRRLDKLENVQK